MKCPKCEYLAFERGDRCRNCGYDFSLSAPGPTALDLVLDREVEHLGPSFDLDRIIGAPSPAPEVTDLPLFPAPARGASGGRGPVMTPSVTPHRRSRAPLGVRRATPEVPRARLPQSKPDPAAEGSLFVTEFDVKIRDRVQPEPTPSTLEQPLASASSRILAALIDGSLLLAVDSVVVYLTLRLCGLTAAESAQLPLLPFTAFLMLLNGGYFVAFTAVGGQSIGKMALGIRVVTQEDKSVSIGRAALRTLAYLVSALPLGAGFLPGVISADRLALHDRLAQTRVVRPA
jgi:uncharacterized RDD family membrane protein YckC